MRKRQKMSWVEHVWRDEDVASLLLVSQQQQQQLQKPIRLVLVPTPTPTHLIRWEEVTGLAPVDPRFLDLEIELLLTGYEPSRWVAQRLDLLGVHPRVVSHIQHQFRSSVLHSPTWDRARDLVNQFVRLRYVFLRCNNISCVLDVSGATATLQPDTREPQMSSSSSSSDRTTADSMQEGAPFSAKQRSTVAIAIAD